MLTHSSTLSRLGWDDRFAATFEATARDATVPARVVKVAARTVTVIGDGGERDAVLAGRLRRSPPPGGVTTGDWVAVDGATVQDVLARRSVLLRRAAGRAAVAQAVAANVDVVFIAVPLGAAVGVRRLERSLAIAWASGARPVVLLTKFDLSADLAVDLAAARAVAGEAEVIAVNADGHGLDTLRSCLAAPRTGAIVGPSGAGKSTLINTLCGDGRLAIAGVRDDGRGRHTTSHRELVELPEGAMIIDTPGMREMGVWDAHAGIETVFADVGALASSCRFSDCSHGSEPGCSVREAAREDPDVLERLASLRKLEREQRFQDMQVDARLRADSRRDVRRFARSTRDQPQR